MTKQHEKTKKTSLLIYHAQHLLTGEEMINNWSFLKDKNQLEKLLFQNPQKIVNKIEKITIQQPPLNYSSTASVKGEEEDLISAYTRKTNEMFGSN